MNDNTELPALPAPDVLSAKLPDMDCPSCRARLRLSEPIRIGFTADQMHAYAREHAASLRAQLEAAERDAAYYRWRLAAILPLFEEARDALPAITMAAAKLHGVDLSLSDRMDRAGTATREQFDAELSKDAQQATAQQPEGGAT